MFIITIFKILINLPKMVNLLNSIGTLLSYENKPYFGQGDTNYRYDLKYCRILASIKIDFESFKTKEYWKYAADAERERWKTWQKRHQ